MRRIAARGRSRQLEEQTSRANEDLHRHAHIPRRWPRQGTGEAKYAGEFNAPGLAHASVVASTIAKGRILRIEAARRSQSTA